MDYFVTKYSENLPKDIKDLQTPINLKLTCVLCDFYLNDFD